MKKIEKYSTGWVFTKRYDNVTIIKEYYCPCFISYKNHLFELHLDFILHHKNGEVDQIRNEDMDAILPTLLENGKMLSRPN